MRKVLMRSSCYFRQAQRIISHRLRRAEMNANRLSGRSAAVLKILALSVLPVIASGSSVSFTRTLATPESVFETTFSVPSSGTVAFQTWGFGGGTNAGGQVVPSGGFDPLIALFSGPVTTATID